MKSTFATLAFAGAAAAAPHAGHSAFHAKKDLLSGLTELASGGNIVNELTTLMTDGLDVFSKLGALPAHNSQTPVDTTWIGEATEGDAVVNTIVNESDEDFVFSCWAAEGSWVNAKNAAIAVRVPAGKNVTISHAVAQAGAQNIGGCGAVFGNTKLVNGQISETWLEYTWLNDIYGGSTFDVSKEVSMVGHNMTVEGPKCKSDNEHCSFHCNDASATSCGEAGSYYLKNCEAGSQPGASAGKWGGQASGGCQGIENTGITKLVTTIA